MTANVAGKQAGADPWAILRTLRDRWMLVMFFAAALVWAQEVWEEISRVPAAVSEATERVGKLSARVAAIETALGDGRTEAAQPHLHLPGFRHSATDSPAGGRTVVHLVPIRAEPTNCAGLEIEAFVIDGAGHWHSAASSIWRLPVGAGDEGELSFSVRVPSEAHAGRAQVVLDLVHDCGGQRVSRMGPRLPFRILANRD